MKYRIIAIVMTMFLTIFVTVELVSENAELVNINKEPVEKQIGKLFEDDFRVDMDSMSSVGDYALLQLPDDTIGSNNHVEVNAVIEVPDVVGLEQHTAIQVLEEHGFSFQVYWYQDVQDHPSERYYIASQDEHYAVSGSIIHLELKQLWE